MDYKFLGKRIREERQKLNLTQEKLSESVGISDSYLGQIERGERSVTLDTLIRLANRLNVTIDYLLKDYVNTDNNMFLNQFAQIIDGHEAKHKEMALDVVKIMFSHIDK